MSNCLKKLERKIYEKINSIKTCLKKQLRDLFKEDYIDFLLEPIWFRGEPSDFGETKLMPTLFRKFLINPKLKDALNNSNNRINIDALLEKRCIEEAWANPFIPEHFRLKEKDVTLESYAYLRHLGFPSRLLDFTEDLYIAIYFGLSRNGQIYILFPRLLNLQISLFHSIGLIPDTTKSYSIYTRLKFANSINSRAWFININWKPTLVEENFSVLREEILGNIFEEGNKTNNYVEKLLLTIEEKKKGINNIENLYSTPIAITFLRNHQIFKNQTAVGVLFGGFIKNKNSIKSLRKFLCKLGKKQRRKQNGDLCNPTSSFRDFRWLVNNVCFIYQIPLRDIFKTLPCHTKIKSELEQLGYHDYIVFGLDPKLIPNYVEKKLILEKLN